jgi:hypothetical protein
VHHHVEFVLPALVDNRGQNLGFPRFCGGTDRRLDDLDARFGERLDLRPSFCRRLEIRGINAA